MSVQSILFENPYALVLALICVEMILLRIWSRRRTVLTGRFAVGGLAAIPVLITIQSLVVTDREQIADVCRELAAAAGQADVAAFGRQISDDFRVAEGNRVWDKGELLEGFEKVLRQWDIEEERLSGFEIEVSEVSATASFQAACRLISNELMIARHLSRWELTLVKMQDTWQVTHINRVARAGWGYDSLPSLLR